MGRTLPAEPSRTRAVAVRSARAGVGPARGAPALFARRGASIRSYAAARVSFIASAAARGSHGRRRSRGRSAPLLGLVFASS
eukprot:354448-Chlamydomonas_euryale.AAC.7